MSSSPWVIDVSETTFQDDVVEKSRSVAVLVDFWASWCGPCQVLGPILGKVAADFDGKLIIAKVNTEQNQELAARFAIRGIPAVKLFRDGAVVDEFVGALPEAAVREFIGKHIKSDTDVALGQIATNRAAGELDIAKTQIDGLLASAPDSSGVRLEAARVALAMGEPEQAIHHAGAVPKFSEDEDAAAAITGAAELVSICQAYGGLETATTRAASNPGDLEALYAQAAGHLGAGDYRSALAGFLDIVGRDRKFRDDGARKAMLVAFALCDDEATVRDFRRKLTILT